MKDFNEVKEIVEFMETHEIKLVQSINRTIAKIENTFYFLGVKEGVEPKWSSFCSDDKIEFCGKVANFFLEG